MIPISCRLFGQDDGQKTKEHDPEKFAGFSDKMMLKTKEHDPEKLQTFRTR
jgi:hypothetical protein